jgi:class 3 adenylate cyclase/tetratricopeptide (TPR) repeat protein
MPACARCGHENPESSRFCNSCGQPLAAPAGSGREERKAVTVVFADLVGSTARADGADPEDVRAVLAPYHARVRHELERHGGTVEKFIGDAVVAVFGAPAAHEDDPERAVRAALAIQEAIAELNESIPALELQVRVGVNTGEALVDLSARPELGEGVVSGDVVNTGARLQGEAPPGGILVGETTKRATERVIEYEPHPAIAAKGKAEPVAAWLALRARGGPGVDVATAGGAPLIGRDREAVVLTAALDRVRAEHEPQLVTIVGVPGIGKSRLVQELARVVDEDPELITWRQGRSLPYGEGVAYWALGEIVKAEAGILETASHEDAAARLAETVGELVADDAERIWVERELRPLVGLDDEERRSERESAAESAAAWRRFVEALAEPRTTVLVFEDLQWADDGLLDFVDGLVDHVVGVPLLVVAAARPELLERRPSWGGGKRNAQTLSLTPLADEDIARLLQTLLDRSVIPADVQSTLLRRAGGIPLFAEEYARMIGRDGVLERVPETLQALVAARIDGLPAEEKLLLQEASVLGKVFWTDALGGLVGRQDVDDLLHSLERKEFVRRERRSAVAGARQYVFVHALVRDVAYGQLTRSARAAAHERVARWLRDLPADRSEERAEMLAHHAVAALDFAQAAGLDAERLVPDAFAALVAAGNRAWNLDLAESALAYYERARSVAPDRADDPQLLLRVGRARLELIGGGAEELERAAAALRDTEPAAAAEAEIIRGEVTWQQGVHEEAFRHFDRALALVAPLPLSERKAFVLGQLARFHSIAGRVAEARGLTEEAVRAAEALGNDRLLGDALNTRGLLRTTVGEPDGIHDLEQALEIGRRIRSPHAPRAFVNLGSERIESQGDLRGGEQVLREGLEYLQRGGASLSGRWLHANLAESLFYQGRWDECLEIVERELVGEDAHYMRGLALELRGLIDLARGSVQVGLDGLRGGLDFARQIRDPQALWPALATRSFGLASVGDRAEAAETLEELARSRAHAEESLRVGPASVLAALATLALPPGERPSVIPTRVLSTPWWGVATRIVSGDLDPAAAALREIGASPLEALTRLALAEALAAEGRGAESVAQADRAQEIFAGLRAALFLERVDALIGGRRAQRAEP